MEIPVKFDHHDSTADVEAQLVIKDVKRDPIRETKAEKTAFYVTLFVGVGCTVTVWLLSVFLTSFYALSIRDSEDGVAIASIPLVGMAVVFIILFPLLVLSRTLCKTECDACPGCYGYTTLIFALLVLLAGLFVAVSAARSPSTEDKVFGGVTAGINFFFGLGILCTVFYFCTKNRR